MKDECEGEKKDKANLAPKPIDFTKCYVYYTDICV